jgi:hypothetical protein
MARIIWDHYMDFYTIRSDRCAAGRRGQAKARCGAWIAEEIPAPPAPGPCLRSAVLPVLLDGATRDGYAMLELLPPTCHTGIFVKNRAKDEKIKIKREKEANQWEALSKITIT